MKISKVNWELSKHKLDALNEAISKEDLKMLEKAVLEPCGYCREYSDCDECSIAAILGNKNGRVICCPEYDTLSGMRSGRLAVDWPEAQGCHDRLLAVVMADEGEEKTNDLIYLGVLCLFTLGVSIGAESKIISLVAFFIACFYFIIFAIVRLKD